MYINIIHHKKFHPKIPYTTLVLNIYMQNFKLYDKYYLYAIFPEAEPILV